MMPCFENVLFSDCILFWKEEINIFIYYTTDIIRKMFVHGNSSEQFLKSKEKYCANQFTPVFIDQVF